MSPLRNDRMDRSARSGFRLALRVDSGDGWPSRTGPAREDGHVSHTILIALVVTCEMHRRFAGAAWGGGLHDPDVVLTRRRVPSRRSAARCSLLDHCRRALSVNLGHRPLPGGAEERARVRLS